MDFFYYTDQNFSLYRARYQKEYNLRACETLESDAPQVPSEHYIVLTGVGSPGPSLSRTVQRSRSCFKHAPPQSAELHST